MLEKENGIESFEFIKKVPSSRWQRVRQKSLTHIKDVTVGTTIVGVFAGSLIFCGILLGVITSASYQYQNNESKTIIPISQALPEQTKFLIDVSMHKPVAQDIKELSKSGLINQEFRVSNGYSLKPTTPLMLAVENKDFAALKTLISQGADVNQETIDGDTALSLSMQVNAPNDISKALIENYGANWKTNNYQLLKNTVNIPQWRKYWINYLAKYSPETLPRYEEIIKNHYSDYTTLIEDLSAKP